MRKILRRWLGIEQLEKDSRPYSVIAGIGNYQGAVIFITNYGKVIQMDTDLSGQYRFQTIADLPRSFLY